MKRSILLPATLLLAAVLCAGAASAIYTYVQASPACPWRVLGTITKQQAYPAVGARDYNEVATIVDANCVLWLDIPERVNSIQLRFETTADADATTIAVLVAANDYLANSSTYDDFGLGCTIALTGGKQVGPHSNFYVDTATVTTGLLTMVAQDSGNDRIVVVQGDLKAYKRIAVVATTLATSSTLYVQARYF